ncbi:AIPR family protein [Limobrevibacterium gyesilva]|uniref:AIPR family protein n=1 Tax=Limobrevibacterium gyesilva TaxID=2991712 RepID=A0AA41YMR8_9PROT|nr:AIPR family protein [Limobrevibacterium gyesilva]MCW3476751.1 AIPR family protein [Limobrevibacterium gyesilva]
MTDEEFRADLMAAVASRAEVHGTGHREAFVDEMLDRLREAGELPDAETCAETLTGSRNRRLEIDAFAFDDADESLHMLAAIMDGGAAMPGPITLTDAREQGFNRLTGVFEQARDGWLTRNIEESRPLWALARRIETSGKPAALRLSILTDRPMSERIRAIPSGLTNEQIPVTYQIWDLTRLKRIHEAQNARDDLEVDLAFLPGGGLRALPATSGAGDYRGYLAVLPGEALADIYLRHGSRLLEGNVRTFLGRRGTVNTGIANTIEKEAERFFAYNNGIATTASGFTARNQPDGSILMTSLTDLQIVNGAQTTASLASLRRSRKLPEGSVFVPMKLSVVAAEDAERLIPFISRFANRQNQVRESDFFANHPFHRRMQEISRRILAPAAGGSQVQTHWFYERARGQYLQEQAGMRDAQRDQWLRRNPRNQLFTKTDMAKVESCFDLLPDTASRGAEKAFAAFADRVTKGWTDEAKRATYSDDWFRAAVARVILFRATEAAVSKAEWYEGGYRAQIVAYATARLSALAQEHSGGGHLDFLKVWAAQSADKMLERQLLSIAHVMMDVLRSPPKAGMNISEWAKQQACREQALKAPVCVLPGFDVWLMGRDAARSATRQARADQEVGDALTARIEIMKLGIGFWTELRTFAVTNRVLDSTDLGIVSTACTPGRIPSDRQAARLLEIKQRCETRGFAAGAPA